METEKKIREIESLVVGLRKLEKFLSNPIEKIRKLRREIDLSIDFLRDLQKNIRKAEKQDLDLVLEIEVSACAETADFGLLDKFFEQTVKLLDRNKREVEEKWEEVKEFRATLQTEESSRPDRS